MNRLNILALSLPMAAPRIYAQELRADINLSDPFIMADAKTKKYYMTGTGGGLWSSPDLETWTYLGFPIQTDGAAWMGASPQVWAAELHCIDGRYYNFATFTNGSVTIDADGHPRRAVHLLSSTLPQGTYRLTSGADATYVPASKCTLDATFFQDTDGSRYLLYCHEWIQNGNGTVEAIRLRPDMKGTEGEGRVLFRAHDATWNTSPVTDGPYVFRTQTGRLGIIWTSWNGDRYVQGVAYSQNDKLFGTWRQEPLPITPDNYGHGMLFRTFEGQLLMAIHSHRNINLDTQHFERHPILFVMDDSTDRLRTVMEYRRNPSPANPARIMVDNPEFNYGKLGWTCTTGAQNQLIAQNQSGAITGNFFESWDPNSFVGEIYQEQSVPNGTYRLTAAAFRSQLASGGRQDAETVWLFANDERTLVSSTTPATYSVTVVVTDGRLRFGLRSERKNFRWMGIDNVSIQYFGPEAITASQADSTARNAAVYLRNARNGKYLNAGQSWGTQAVLADHPLDFHLVQLPNGHYALDSRISNGSLDHYAAANGYLDGRFVQFDIKETGTTDEVGRPLVNLAVKDGNATRYWGSTSGTTVSTTLADPGVKGAQWQLLTFDQLLATLTDATPTAPADATFLIQCPNFGRNDTRITAWEGATLTRGGDVKNQCAEGPTGKFDVHQTITNIPNGVYELSVQGFSRGAVATLYANKTTRNLMDIADEKGTQPTDLDAASTRFSAGKYQNTIRTTVTDGQMTIGIRRTATAANTWCVFDNVELRYLGTEETVGINEIVNSHLSARRLRRFALRRTANSQLSTLNSYDMSGKPSRHSLSKGIYVQQGKKFIIR